jgi:hypothetical protein
MTTVAWRDGVLAADRKGSLNGTGHRVTKLRRTKTHAIAFAGTVSTGIQFIDWFKGARDGECPLDRDTSAFVMDLETGKCEHWENGVPCPIEDKFAAIGSGMDLAIGAMSFGASAIEAVECASEWDNGSGLGINFARSRPHARRSGKKKELL